MTVTESQTTNTLIIKGVWRHAVNMAYLSAGLQKFWVKSTVKIDRSASNLG